jgi:hypothetical protein
VPPPIGLCLGPAQRAEVAAQPLKGRRAGLALGTIAVLFRVVPRAANHARPIWNTIPTGEVVVPLYLRRDLRALTCAWEWWLFVRWCRLGQS